MIKKTVASVSLGVAAAAGAAFLMQSPASAETVHTSPASVQTVHTSAKTAVTHVQTTAASKVRRSTDYRDRTYDHSWGYGRYHHRPHYYWSNRYHRYIVVYTDARY
jgi:hypothetical protein